MDNIQNMEERIETLIFLSKEKLSVEELARFYKTDREKMMEIVTSLKEKRKKSGINIRIENDIVSLVSNPLYGEDVKKFFNPEMKIKKLTKSAMETLAIIAYKGPVTKGEIESIRGVGVEKTMSNLLEKNLVFISGRKKSIGTPNLYQVTEDFYSYLNVSGKDELPGYEQFEKIELLQKTAEEEIDDVENLKSIEERMEERLEEKQKEKLEVKNEIE